MPVLNVERPDFMQDEDIRMFEDSVGRFFEQNAKPEDVERWRANHCVDREMWTKAGEAGLLNLSMPEEYGGMGGDYRHEVILMEQIGAKGVDGFGASLHKASVMPYILHYGTEEQKEQHVPALHGRADAGVLDTYELRDKIDMSKFRVLKYGTVYTWPPGS